MWAALLVLFFTGHAAALEGPRLNSQAGPVLVEIGGWQIFANEVYSHGRHLRFEGVQANRGSGGPWTLVADHLLVGLRPQGLVEVDGWWASGNVRLSGPDDLYVMAHQLVALQPDRRLLFVGENGFVVEDEVGGGKTTQGDHTARAEKEESNGDRSGRNNRAALVGANWQLTAAHIDVDLRTARVSLEQPAPPVQTASPKSLKR